MAISRPLFLIFVLFTSQFNYKVQRHRCCALDSNPGAARWWAQLDPVSDDSRQNTEGKFVLKWANPALFFVYFRSFLHKFFQKKL